MGRDVLSSTSYAAVASEARSAGSATFRGEQRIREGKGLNPLVDPKGGGVIRRSLSWYEPSGKRFQLLRGVALPFEDLLDTTGSMGDNVEIAMRVLPKTYDLLVTGKNPVASRYDVQIATSIFGDVCDRYVLNRSEFEFDERIADQMTNMYPEHGGGDSDEDPQYGLTAAALLTDATIYGYGLKGYHSTISDARGRPSLRKTDLVRIFGDEVFEKFNENGAKYGFTISERDLPSTKEVVQELLKRSHAFFYQVGRQSAVTRFWTDIFGAERVIQLPDTELLPYVKATVVGLTEGTLDLQSVLEFLLEVGLPKYRAESIQRAVAGIPLGAQAELENFDKLPLKGAIFEKKGDLWPIEGAEAEEAAGTDEGEDAIWA